MTALDQRGRQDRVDPFTWSPAPRREYLVAAAVAVAVVGFYVAIAAVHGALGASRNDDWAYFRIVTHLADTGEFRLDGWVQTMFIGQALVSLPVIALFGERILPLQLLVAVFAAVGLWATYAVIRPWLGRRWTVLAVGCVAVGPVYGIVSVSYMSDVPSYALQMLTLLAGVRAMRATPVHLGWLAAALALGFVSFSIREYGVASGVTVAVYAVVHAWAGRQRVRTVTALAATWLASVAALYLWRSGLPNTYPTPIDLSPTGLRNAADELWRSALTVGLFIAPAAFVVSPLRLLRAARERMTRRVKVALLVLGVALIATVDVRGLGLVGNHADRRVAYWRTLPGEPARVLPGPVWIVLLLIGIYSTAVSVVMVSLRVEVWLRHRRTWRTVLASTADRGAHLSWLFVVLYAALLAAAVGLTTTDLFDRYLLVLVPLSAALVVHAGHAERLVRELPGRRDAVAMVGLATLGLVVVDGSATFDGAKWRLGEEVAARTGWEPGSIDAGYEWFGYHQSSDLELQSEVTGPVFWRALFAPRPICASGSFAPSDPTEEPGGTVVATVTGTGLFGVDVRLVAVAGPDTCP
jgi:hypothetical protein